MQAEGTRIFVDTDVCLDLLTGRQPFNAVAAKLFSQAEKSEFQLCVSSLSFSNIDYLLQSQYKLNDSRKILAKLKSLVTVLAVDETVIDRSITSDFVDFEDAIQYHTAIGHQISMLLTRNLKHYKKAKIQVMNPETFLSGRR